MPWSAMHWHVRQRIADTVAILQCYLCAVAQRDNYRVSQRGCVIWFHPGCVKRSFNTVDERAEILSLRTRDNKSCKMKNPSIASLVSPPSRREISTAGNLSINVIELGEKTRKSHFPEYTFKHVAGSFSPMRGKREGEREISLVGDTRVHFHEYWNAKSVWPKRRMVFRSVIKNKSK